MECTYRATQAFNLMVEIFEPGPFNSSVTHILVKKRSHTEPRRKRVVGAASAAQGLAEMR